MRMSATNRRRWLAVRISRRWKDLLVRARAPGGWRWAGRLLGRRWAYRAVFTEDGVALRVAAQQVLADLRDFSFARTSAFDPDPVIMARRQGRRDVWLRISNYLNLDEAQVQWLMEIDDE